MRLASALAVAIVAALSLGARCNDCGPNSPTGPCEVDCGSYTCPAQEGNYCCADGVLCCPEGYTCAPDTTGGHCDAPWPEPDEMRRHVPRRGAWKR